MDHRCSPPLVACVWKDKRIIKFLPASIPRTTVSAGAVTREKVACPLLLPDYQAFMRGVDRGDQLIQYYNMGRRSKKWWKRIFSYMVLVSCLNAYIILRDGLPPSERKKYAYLTFRYSRFEELIGSFTSRTRPVGRPRSIDNQEALQLDATKNHLPIVDRCNRDCVVCKKVG